MAYDELEVNSGAYTPQSMILRRKLAEAMAKQGLDTSPIASPWQGVSRVLQAMMAGKQMGDLEAKERDAYGRAGNATADLYDPGGVRDQPSLSRAPASAQPPSPPREGMTRIGTADDKTIQVSERGSERFSDLIADLKQHGIEIDPDQTYGYADRNIKINGRDTGHKSKHARGDAIDINADANPEGRLSTSMPSFDVMYGDEATAAKANQPTQVINPDIARAMAAKHGLKWLGDRVNGGPDPMHFELPDGTLLPVKVAQAQPGTVTDVAPTAAPAAAPVAPNPAAPQVAPAAPALTANQLTPIQEMRRQQALATLRNPNADKDSKTLARALLDKLEAYTTPPTQKDQIEAANKVASTAIHNAELGGKSADSLLKQAATDAALAGKADPATASKEKAKASSKEHEGMREKAFASAETLDKILGIEDLLSQPMIQRTYGTDKTDVAGVQVPVPSANQGKMGNVGSVVGPYAMPEAHEQSVGISTHGIHFPSVATMLNAGRNTMASMLPEGNTMQVAQGARKELDKRLADLMIANNKTAAAGPSGSLGQERVALLNLVGKSSPDINSQDEATLRGNLKNNTEGVLKSLQESITRGGVAPQDVMAKVPLPMIERGVKAGILKADDWAPALHALDQARNIIEKAPPDQQQAITEKLSAELQQLGFNPRYITQTMAPFHGRELAEPDPRARMAEELKRRTATPNDTEQLLRELGFRGGQ